MDQLMHGDLRDSHDTPVAPYGAPRAAMCGEDELLAREAMPFIGLAASVECLWDELRCFCLQLGCPAFRLVDLSAGGASEAGPANVSILVDLDELRRELSGAAREAVLIDGQTLALPVFGPQGVEAAILVRLALPVCTVPGWASCLALACQLAYARYRQLAPRAPAGDMALSEREREIMHWVKHGKSNAVIASILGISQSTVDTYMRRIFRKLDVADRTSAAMRAVATGAIV